MLGEYKFDRHINIILARDSLYDNDRESVNLHKVNIYKGGDDYYVE